jgi:hypothetical protein
MEYKIISGSEHEEVAKEVNELLTEGWKIYGHLGVVPFRVKSDEGARYDYCIYTQAMIKGDESLGVFVQDVA